MTNMRRAKIVCTLGPATDNFEQLKALIEAGMNAPRRTIRPGSHAQHEARYATLRSASAAFELFTRSVRGRRARTPRGFLKPGDEIRASFSGLGEQRLKVVAEA